MSPTGSTRPLGRALRALAVTGALLAAPVLATPALAAPAPYWKLESRSAPTNLAPGTEAEIEVTAANLGAGLIKGNEDPITLTDTLPEGLEVKKIETTSTGVGRGRSGPTEECTAVPVTPIVCKFTRPLLPFEQVNVYITVKVGATPPADPANHVTVSGGGLAEESLARALKYSTAPVRFGVEQLELVPENENGTPDTQAGSHPFQLTTVFSLNETRTTQGALTPGLQRNVSFKLPPGLIGNANVLANLSNSVKQCTSLDFDRQTPAEYTNGCPLDTAVGVAAVTINEPTPPGPGTFLVPVFNLVPARGEPAAFGFFVAKVPIVLSTSVRSGEDYGVTVKVENASQVVDLLSSRVTLWGVPTDSVHNLSRGWGCLDHFYKAPGPCEPEFKVEEPAAFLTLPTTCKKPLSVGVSGTSWPLEGGEVRSFGENGQSLENTTYTFPQALTGCELLGFSPTISVEPELEEAATPSGLTVKVHYPQEGLLSAGGLAPSTIRATTLKFPVGIQPSGGAANGLLTCTSGQFGFNGGEAFGEPSVETLTENDHFDTAAIECPEAAKVGTVTISSPLLENELTGAVYLASKNTNPFVHELVLYAFAEDPVSGVKVKLAGEVNINEATGALTTVFRETPPVPFEDLTFHIFGGPRASLATPEACGEYHAEGSFAGWSGATEPISTAPFSITSRPGEPECPAPGTQPFAPSFQAGSQSPQAGAFSPFIVNINRPDGQQALKTVTVHEPPGAAAILASVTPCPIAQATALPPTCGADSLIGHSSAVAGLGSEPVTIPGQVYLTGPYKGAPFGLLSVSDAEPPYTGPFNLGKISVLSTISVNEVTAAATITSDPLPQLVKGIPSQIKSLNIVVDRPNFTFNPTNCSALAVTATLTGYGPPGGSDGVQNLSSPYHAANCASLAFKPTLEASIESNVSRSTGTGLTITVHASPGQANIARSKIEFPTTVPSRLTTLQKSCRDTVFDVNPANCSPESIVGTGTAHTPVLKSPLTGPIYLVSHGNAAFPDAEFVLQGEGIKLVLDGKTDIEKGITISTFESVPDAPVETFEVSLPRGTKSAFSGYGDLCTENPVMPTVFTGQNGKVLESVTKLNVTGCAGVLASHTESELAKNLKICNKIANKGKRAKCVASAHRRANALAACKKLAKKSKRPACEAKARKKNPLKH